MHSLLVNELLKAARVHAGHNATGTNTPSSVWMSLMPHVYRNNVAHMHKAVSMCHLPRNADLMHVSQAELQYFIGEDAACVSESK